MAWLDREVNFSGRVGGKRGCIYFTKCHDNVLLHGSLLIPHRSGLESRVLYIGGNDTHEMR